MTAAPLVHLDRAEKRLAAWTPPRVVDGVIVAHPYRSPLDADEAGIYPTALRGGVVADPAEVERIRARVEAPAAGGGAWRRVLRRIRTGR